jgi:hypothetical protein
MPPDFDIALISWKPDYDAFYYRELRKRARKMFLFRDEFIFDRLSRDCPRIVITYSLAEKILGVGCLAADGRRA